MSTMRDVKILLSVSVGADISDLPEQQFKIVSSILADGRKDYAILVDDEYLECIRSFSDVQAVLDGIARLEAYIKNTRSLFMQVSWMVEDAFNPPDPNNALDAFDIDFAENEGFVWPRGGL